MSNDLKAAAMIAVLFPLFYTLSWPLAGVPLENYVKIVVLIGGVLFLALKRPVKLDGLGFAMVAKAIKGFAVYRRSVFEVASFVDATRVCFDIVTYQIGRSISAHKVLLVTVLISCAISAYALPYLVFGLGSFSAGYDLSIYGLTTSGYSGLYQNSHAAGITHAIAASILFYVALFHRFRLTRLILILFAMTLSLAAVYYSFTRTSWIIVLLMFAYITASRTLLRGGAKFGLLAVAVAAVVVVIAMSNPVVMDRLLDRNIYQQSLNEGRLGSGRLFFWASALDAWQNFSPAQKIFGIGRGETMEVMFGYTRLYIVGHNSYVDALLLNGAIGLVLEIVTIVLLANRMIRSTSNYTMYHLRIALLIGYLSITMLQGGYFFYVNIIVFLLASTTQPYYPGKVRIIDWQSPARTVPGAQRHATDT